MTQNGSISVNRKLVDDLIVLVGIFQLAAPVSQQDTEA